MNTLHLKYVLEVAKTGSITLAAENLFMNQPNLSKIIKEMEETFGIDIFKRTSKGIVPTKKGEEFLSYAKNILAQVEEMEAFYKTNKKNKITFAVSVPRAGYISYAYTLFIQKLDPAKNWEMSFKETNSMDAVKDVAEGESRIGIIRYQKYYESFFLDFLKDKKLQHEELWNFKSLALMSKNNPLASSDSLSCDELDQCIEIRQGDVSVPYLTAADAGKSQRNKKRLIYVYEQGSQLDLLNSIPHSYVWVSPLPAQMLEWYGLVQKDCPSSNHSYKDVLIYPKGYQLSKIDRIFVNEVKQVKNSILSAFQ